MPSAPDDPSTPTASAPSGSDSASPAVTIDHTAFPYIIDQILGYTSYDEWIVLRQTSREFHDRMDSLLWRHVHIGSYGHLSKTPLGRVSAVLKHVAILDGDDLESQLPIDVATVFAKLRLVRHRFGSLEDISVPKVVTWEYFPCVVTCDDKWGEMVSEGLAELKNVRHHVLHFGYDKRSAVIPPFGMVKTWAELEKATFIFTEDRRKRFGFGMDDGILSAEDIQHAEWLAENPPDDETQSGRRPPLDEIGSLLQLLGVQDDKDEPIYPTVEITLVGLDEFIDVGALATKPEKRKNVNPRVILRKTMAYLMKNYYVSPARTKQIMSQIKLMTHQEYADLIGLDEYWLETREDAQAPVVKT